ncbi:MAG: nucleotide sugar dehydrogenase [Bacteroidetes bacterium]|nr:nucleotide sugar dehydrogenase [Bacteroidota bacterium]
MKTIVDTIYSGSLLTGEKFPIPDSVSDKDNLDKFVAKHEGKKIVVVQGLGFVGSIMSLIVANTEKENYTVIGIDLPNEDSYWKICSINKGEFPIVSADESIQTGFKSVNEKGNLYATYDPYAYSLADIVIVDVSLDVAKEYDEKNELSDYEVLIGPFKDAITTISINCKVDALIIVETTIPPGTCEKIIKPILDEAFQRRGIKPSYKLGYAYERVTPGENYLNSVINQYRVYAGVDEASAKAIETFLETIINTEDYPLTLLHSTTAAEIAKVLENSYRAANIAFIQEWTEYAEEAKVNLYEILDAIRMRPTHDNIMQPGLGVGGYCLPKDPLIADWARKDIFQSNEELSVSRRAVEINDKMSNYAFDLINRHHLGDLSGKYILLLGVSYIGNVADTRNTPVEALYDSLVDSGCKITIHDPYVTFWNERELDIENSLEACFENKFDIIVFCVKHSFYVDHRLLNSLVLAQKDLYILDTIGMMQEEMIDQFKKKHRVSIIGRGDI